MSTPIEALKMALEVLENVRQYDKGDWYGLDDAIDAIKEALAQPEQEPVAWIGLTGEEKTAIERKHGLMYFEEVFYDIEAKLKGKNT